MRTFLRGRIVTAVTVAAAVLIGAAAVPPATAAAQPSNPTVQLGRSAYEDSLWAMWQGESIANWTGLKTENLFPEPPFLTDADWGSDKGSSNPSIGSRLEFAGPPPGLEGKLWNDRTVWAADDDTDVEYVYLHGMANTYRDVWLTPERIAALWRAHIKRKVWASNDRARLLMEAGALPPTTGLNVANPSSLLIDAQLVTEIFGALAPGRPRDALRLADLPIRTVAEGHAAHAAQFFVVLYSLATSVDKSQPRREQVLWLTREARKYVPNGSKAADIVDFVLAEFLAEDDVTDWESTRDRIYQRYASGAAANGFVYRSQVESSINFATGIMALLYGQGSFRDTVRIGTLSCCDSDNSTATLGGLLGLMYGRAGLQAEFPDRVLHEDFWVAKTRDNLPDYLPADETADDTFTLMSRRMLPLVDQVVREAGGTVAADRWTIPTGPGAPAPADAASVAAANPLSELYRRSANNRVRLEGGTVTGSLDPAGYDRSTEVPGSRGSASASHFVDGREANWSGREAPRANSTFSSAKGRDGRQTFAVEYDRAVPVHTVRVNFGDTPGVASAVVQLRGTDGTWRDAPAGSVWTRRFDDRPYLQNDLQLGATVEATGVRLVGTLRANSVTTMAEIDALRPPGPGATTVIEAESLLPTLGGTAPAGPQDDCCNLLWSGGAQLFVRAARVGDTASVRFTAPSAGTYRLALSHTRAPDFGTARIGLNGTALREVVFASTSGFAVAREDLGEVQLRAGANTLTFEVTGRPAASTAYGFGVDALELRAVG